MNLPQSIVSDLSKFAQLWIDERNDIVLRVRAHEITPEAMMHLMIETHPYNVFQNVRIAKELLTILLMEKVLKKIIEMNK